MLLSEWEEVVGFANFREALFYWGRTMAETEEVTKYGISEEPEPMAPKACKSCRLWSDMKQRLRIAEILEKIAENFQTKVADPNYKPTVAEYLKLVQLEQEYEKDDGPKEIRVSWVDSMPASEN